MFDYLIAVATINGPARLEAFIASIKQHTKGFNYGISICDDCSNNDLAAQNHQIAQKYQCFYRRNDERSGVPTSWNRAIQIGHAGDARNYIVANDDILVVPGWLNAYDEFRKANEHLKLGVVAWPAAGNINLLKNEQRFSVGVDHSHIITPIVACAGYLFGFSKEQYQQVGGFDERYFATWEEIDFGAKLCMNGQKSVGMNAPMVYHQGGASFGDPINRHVAMNKQSLAQDQWIDKWSIILNISKTNKTSRELIIEISNALTAKIPPYKIEDFNSVNINLNISHDLDQVKVDNDIHGWFDFNGIYKDMVKKAKHDAIFVEVGSWLGKSACYMASLIRASGKKINFYCVDIWSDFIADPALASEINNSIQTGISMVEKFKNNMKKYGVLDYTIPTPGWSWEMADKFENNSVDFCFIDAGHDYESVKKDIESWWPKIKNYGYIGGHDYNHATGVKKAVDEFFLARNIIVKNINGSWFVGK